MEGTFNGRQPLMEGTIDGRQTLMKKALMEDSLWGKMTFDGRTLFMQESPMIAAKTKSMGFDIIEIYLVYSLFLFVKVALDFPHRSIHFHEFH